MPARDVLIKIEVAGKAGPDRITATRYVTREGWDDMNGRPESIDRIIDKLVEEVDRRADIELSRRP